MTLFAFQIWRQCPSKYATNLSARYLPSAWAEGYIRWEKFTVIPVFGLLVSLLSFWVNFLSQQLGVIFINLNQASCNFRPFNSCCSLLREHFWPPLSKIVLTTAYWLPPATHPLPSNSIAFLLIFFIASIFNWHLLYLIYILSWVYVYTHIYTYYIHLYIVCLS